MMSSALIQSPLGPIYLEEEEGTICCISFRNEDAGWVAPATPLLQQAADELGAYFSGETRTFSFPIKQPGTSFQQSIWQLLRDIPFGHTRSYRELTLLYGDIKAIRAVANANGKNKLAIVVPCHRVIGSNRSLTGYAGGLWRKQWLLEHEAKYTHGVQSLF